MRNSGTISAATFAVALPLLADLAMAQEPRTFQSIQVEGNERFSDGEIIESSGLKTGAPLSEDDIVAAVEALDYTGEFQNVHVVSNGNVLTISVEEEPPYAGELLFGLGYNTDLGLVGSATVQIEDLFAKGMSLGAGLEISDQAQTFNGEISSETFWGGKRAGGVMAAFENFDYDSTTYDYQTAAVSPFLTHPLSDRTWLEFRYTLSTGDVRDVQSDASPIIQAEEGELLSSGVGFSFVMDNLGPDGNAAQARQWTIRLDQDFTGLGGDTNYSRTELSLFGRAPIGDSGLAIRSRVEMGTVVAFAGSEPRAPDRFALGGSSLRGFELGTVNPRDVCLGCASDGGDLITNLGGNYYAVARTDLILPRIPRLKGLDTFVFADVGSAWEVRTDVAPAGELDDALAWRSSAGVGLSWNTQLGDFEGYYSLAEDRQDFDEIQKFGLTFRTRF